MPMRMMISSVLPVELLGGIVVVVVIPGGEPRKEV